MTEISLQWAGVKLEPKAGDTIARWHQAGGHHFKIVNDLSLLDRLYPTDFRVMRMEHFQHDWQDGIDQKLADNSDAVVKAWLDFHLPLADAHPGVVWEIGNEWQGWDWQMGRWVLKPDPIKRYAHMEALICQSMRAHGHTASIWHFAVSQPPYEATPLMTESLAAANQGLHHAGLHCYDSPYVTSSLGGEGRPEDFLYRYHEIDTRFNFAQLYPNLHNGRWYCSEFFIDQINGNGYKGWKIAMNAVKAEEQLYRVAGPILASHSELKCVFVYCAGRDGTNPDRKAEFDVLDARSDYDLFSRMLPHLAEAPTTPPPTPAPLPTPTPGPLQAYRVVNPGGVNVRRTPNKIYDPIGFLPFDYPLMAKQWDANWVILSGSSKNFFVARVDAGKILLEEI